MQNCKRPHDMNPPTEAKRTRDDLDSIGGFKWSLALLHSKFGSSKQPEKHSMHFVSYKRACVIMAACGT